MSELLLLGFVVTEVLMLTLLLMLARRIVDERRRVERLRDAIAHDVIVEVIGRSGRGRPRTVSGAEDNRRVYVSNRRVFERYGLDEGV